MVAFIVGFIVGAVALFFGLVVASLAQDARITRELAAATAKERDGLT